MLVLTRKKGESIRIGNDIYLIVLAPNFTTRLGFIAPPEINIVRTEIIKDDENSPLFEFYENRGNK